MIPELGPSVSSEPDLENALFFMTKQCEFMGSVPPSDFRVSVWRVAVVNNRHADRAKDRQRPPQCRLTIPLRERPRPRLEKIRSRKFMQTFSFCSVLNHARSNLAAKNCSETR